MSIKSCAKDSKQKVSLAEEQRVAKWFSMPLCSSGYKGFLILTLKIKEGNMSQNFENKKVLVSEIIEKAKNAKSIVLAEYKGLTVEQDHALRNECRANSIDYRVYKNRLIKRAFTELGITMPDEVLEGQTSIAFGQDDVTAAKILVGKETDTKLKVKSGYGLGKVLSEAEVRDLAKIPTKEVLLAQLVGMLSMPMRNLAVTIAEIAKTK